MKDFSSLTPDRLRELAFAANYSTSHFGGEGISIPDVTLAGFQRYGQAVYEEMQNGAWISFTPISRLCKLAAEHSGFRPYDANAAGIGDYDHHKVVVSSAQEGFYYRFAIRISLELEKED